MNFKHIALAAALVALPASAALAQTTHSERHHIAQRKVNQQGRIAQGVRSGQMTPRETAHVERQEGAINREEHAMRAQDNGRLTAGDRHVLAHQQNAESRRIYRDKHNGATDLGVPPR
ncbi:MAG TPA: hypothetical protein VGN16_21260 [Acidobacteriaceae bacterium]|jgi:DNA-binding transcriptional regulator of glucitol operon